MTAARYPKPCEPHAEIGVFGDIVRVPAAGLAQRGRAKFAALGSKCTCGSAAGFLLPNRPVISERGPKWFGQQKATKSPIRGTW